MVSIRCFSWTSLSRWAVPFFLSLWTSSALCKWRFQDIVLYPSCDGRSKEKMWSCLLLLSIFHHSHVQKQPNVLIKIPCIQVWLFVLLSLGYILSSHSVCIVCTGKKRLKKSWGVYMCRWSWAVALVSELGETWRCVCVGGQCPSLYQPSRTVVLAAE